MAATILLVDDEASLRRLAERLITKLGYRVIVAGNADEAAASCRDCPDPIDLLITDVFMPDIAGPDLAARLTTIRPSMKVLFVSGSDEVAQNKHLYRGDFLQKPYTQDQLKAKLREILGA